MLTQVPAIGTIYCHYKGHSYKIIGIARHSETHEELVVYQALYDSMTFGPRALWVRPLSLFLDTVIVDGITQPRFRLLQQ